MEDLGRYLRKDKARKKFTKNADDKYHSQADVPLLTDKELSQNAYIYGFFNS